MERKDFLGLSTSECGKALFLGRAEGYKKPQENTQIHNDRWALLRKGAIILKCLP
jgi:hypothetical protein